MLNNLPGNLIRKKKVISKHASLSLEGLFMVQVPVLDILLLSEEQSDILFYFIN